MCIRDRVYDFAEIIPTSALRGQNTDDVINSIFKYLPYGPQFYDEDTITDQPEMCIRDRYHTGGHSTDGGSHRRTCVAA